MVAATIPLLAEEELARQRSRSDRRLAPYWRLLEAVRDPELPALSIGDLGILRMIERDDERLCVTITPTYSGCPAVDAIRDEIEQTLDGAGVRARIEVRLAPPWSSEWMSDAGRERLLEHGVAPPLTAAERARGLGVQCPHCRARNASLISQYSSTACKALYRCGECLEAFDYFKDF